MSLCTEPFIPTNIVGSSSILGVFVVYFSQKQSIGGKSMKLLFKELFNWTDTYTIDVRNPGDALYALMLVLAIDAEKCSRKD
jgi:hypothetical protein